MGSTVKKIALLSGGGDCPGLNAVIRTITKTAISKYGYEVIGFVYGYRGLYHNNYVLAALSAGQRGGSGIIEGHAHRALAGALRNHFHL